jgi:hypothetical protein
MGVGGDLTPEEVRALMDAYDRGGRLGDTKRAIPSIGANTVEPLLFGMSRLKRALQLSITREYLAPPLSSSVPTCYSQLALELARSWMSDVRWIILGAGTGALICGAGGSAIPVVGNIGGASAGAALGAGIATYIITGVGVISAAKIIGQITGLASVDIQEGIRTAVAGRVEEGARHLASGIAKILGFAIPTLVLMLVGKGGKAAMNKILRKPAIAQYLERMPAPLTNLAGATGVLGMTAEEIRGIAKLSQGKLIVVRGCNPARLKYMGMNYHAKPVYIKWKSAKGGEYAGQVVLTQEEAMKVLQHYQGHPPGATTMQLRPSSELVSKGNRPLMDAPDPLTGGPWLEDHKLQKFVDVDGQTKYRLLHPDGKPFVGDLDRVVYAELTPTGVMKPGKFSKQGHWQDNDDVREIQYLNSQMQARMQNPVSYNIFQHGYAWNNVQKGKDGSKFLGWPRREGGTYQFDDEPLLVCCNGHVYIMGWKEFAELSRCHTNVGLSFPWSSFTVR